MFERLAKNLAKRGKKPKFIHYDTTVDNSSGITVVETTFYYTIKPLHKKRGKQIYEVR